MQNADNEASKSQTTKAEQDEEEGAAALASVEDQLDEDQSKLKTRSRFSAAFRSFSKPKSKKPKELPQKEKPKSEEQLALLSATEEDQSIDTGLKKKRSLTRRLLLGGLSKSKTKVRPHSLATSDEISLKSSSSKERAPAATTSSGGSSTLQITISGKKVEKKASKAGKSSNKSSKSKSHNSETDYLTPTPEAETATATAIAIATATATEPGNGKSRSTTTTLTTTSSSREDTTTRTTKLIVAKVAASTTTKQKQPKQLKLKAATASSVEQQEKIVITESRRDTPPHERAPAKPSRANANQLATSSGAVRKSTSSSSSSKERDLLQQQQQRGHRIVKHRSSSNTGTTAAPALPVQALETPTTYSPPTPPAPPPPPPPTSTLVLVSLSDVEEQTDAVSLAESAGTQLPPPPVVRFAVGSAVRGPAADADAYEAALVAAAAQQPSSSEEPSDSSVRRHSFAKQKFALSDHDSIEGRRETVHYKSVHTSGSNEEEEVDSVSVSEEDGGEAKPMPAFGDLTMDQEMEPTIMAPSSEKREHLYKILVIGELGTGKTSFIKRYVHQFFSQNYRATIGVDFALKVLHWDTNTIVRLQLWDIAGQERFGNMTRVYYKEAVGAFIVFDVTRSGTFDCVSKWKEDLDSKVQLPDGSPIPCILLANKCDQEKQGIVTQPERMDEYVRENGFAGWFETSAKENINIDEAARALVSKILINDKLIAADANDAEKFNLSSAADASADAKSKCAC